MNRRGLSGIAARSGSAALAAICTASMVGAPTLAAAAPVAPAVSLVMGALQAAQGDPTQARHRRAHQRAARADADLRVHLGTQCEPREFQPVHSQYHHPHRSPASGDRAGSVPQPGGGQRGALADHRVSSTTTAIRASRCRYDPASTGPTASRSRQTTSPSRSTCSKSNCARPVPLHRRAEVGRRHQRDRQRCAHRLQCPEPALHDPVLRNALRLALHRAAAHLAESGPEDLHQLRPGQGLAGVHRPLHADLVQRARDRLGPQRQLVGRRGQAGHRRRRPQVAVGHARPAAPHLHGRGERRDPRCQGRRQRDGHLLAHAAQRVRAGRSAEHQHPVLVPRSALRLLRSCSAPPGVQPEGATLRQCRRALGHLVRDRPPEDRRLRLRGDHDRDRRLLPADAGHEGVPRQRPGPLRPVSRRQAGPRPECRAHAGGRLHAELRRQVGRRTGQHGHHADRRARRRGGPDPARTHPGRPAQRGRLRRVVQDHRGRTRSTTASPAATSLPTSS